MFFFALFLILLCPGARSLGQFVKGELGHVGNCNYFQETPDRYCQIDGLVHRDTRKHRASVYGMSMESHIIIDPKWHVIQLAVKWVLFNPDAPSALDDLKLIK
jgi:hypothetical protein